jgi:hypothetical protein
LNCPATLVPFSAVLGYTRPRTCTLVCKQAGLVFRKKQQRLTQSRPAGCLLPAVSKLGRPGGGWGSEQRLQDIMSLKACRARSHLQSVDPLRRLQQHAFQDGHSVGGLPSQHTDLRQAQLGKRGFGIQLGRLQQKRRVCGGSRGVSVCYFLQLCRPVQPDD